MATALSSFTLNTEKSQCLMSMLAICEYRGEFIVIGDSGDKLGIAIEP